MRIARGAAKSAETAGAHAEAEAEAAGAVGPARALGRQCASEGSPEDTRADDWATAVPHNRNNK